MLQNDDITDELIQQKDQFDKWTDNMTRRRMFAFSKMKKFEKYHTERMKFYDRVDKIVKEDEQIMSDDDSCINNTEDDKSKLTTDNT